MTLDHNSISRKTLRQAINQRVFEGLLVRKKATPEIAGFFGIQEGGRCVIMEHVRGSQSYPFVYFVSYFNPALPITGDENYKLPLYEMLEIPSDDPILIRKRFVYDENGVPVEYNVGYYRADSFTYTLESER
ncbi:MAG: UTRA domain-containing protein [Bacteroidales bacterium]|nr:UTRA domain-containing protein [Bacteroidales bacterium]